MKRRRKGTLLRKRRRKGTNLINRRRKGTILINRRRQGTILQKRRRESKISKKRARKGTILISSHLAANALAFALLKREKNGIATQPRAVQTQLFKPKRKAALTLKKIIWQTHFMVCALTRFPHAGRHPHCLHQKRAARSSVTYKVVYCRWEIGSPFIKSPMLIS